MAGLSAVLHQTASGIREARSDSSRYDAFTAPRPLGPVARGVRSPRTSRDGPLDSNPILFITRCSMTTNAVTCTLPSSRSTQRSDRTNQTWGLQVTNPDAHRRIQRLGIVALGEAYEQGHWQCDNLEDFMYRVFTGLPPALSLAAWSKLLLAALDQRLFNRQNGRGAFNIGLKHYDLGNDLFRCMLDSSMTYTSGYWAHATTLHDAQEAKLDLICRKLNLRP